MFDSLWRMRYDERWKAVRKAAHEALSPQACRSHLEVQQAEGVQLAFNFLSEPNEFYNHIRRYAHSVIMSVMFGMRLPRSKTQFLVDFWAMTDDLVDITNVTNHPPVDLIPLFKLVPERFARWKSLCRSIRDAQRRLFVPLVQEVESRVASGEAIGCRMEEICMKAADWGLDKEDVLYLGYMIVQAGSDTTAVFLQSLVLYLMAYPHVMQRAQEEMDKVVGSDRMPQLHDFERLPYVRALVAEILRVRPPTPIGVPHMTTADVSYDGYVIPKGSMVIQNIWGIFSDENIFENPKAFDPERFIKHPELEKLTDSAFGAGRRYCVGINLARNSLVINTMNIIWGFNIEKGRGSLGNEIEPDVSCYEDGLVTYPLPFEATIKPRSQQHEAILRQEFKNTEYTFKPYERLLSEEDKQYVANVRTNA